VSRYQKKHSPTHHPDHHPIFISFFHLLRCIASSLFKLRDWQSFCTTSFHVLFGLPLGQYCKSAIDMSPPPQPFYGHFSGTTRVSRCQKRTSGLMVQGKINRGRHTDYPAGHHSIRTNQCPPPPSPHIFYRPDALPAAQPTASMCLHMTFYRYLCDAATMHGY